MFLKYDLLKFCSTVVVEAKYYCYSDNTSDGDSNPLRVFRGVTQWGLNTDFSLLDYRFLGINEAMFGFDL